MLDKSGDVSRGAKTKATPAVNPKTNRAGPAGRCHHSAMFDCSEATGQVYAQLGKTLKAVLKTE